MRAHSPYQSVSPRWPNSCPFYSSDILPWQSHARHGSACDEVLFVDIDYPDLMIKKRAVVLETPQLRELLGADFKVSESHEDQVLLKSERYCQIGCDLRQLDKLRAMLETFLSLAKCEVLFVAEVSVTYMDTHSADSLIQWASSIGKCESLTPGPSPRFEHSCCGENTRLSTQPSSASWSKSSHVARTIPLQRQCSVTLTS